MNDVCSKTDLKGVGDQLVYHIEQGKCYLVGHD